MGDTLPAGHTSANEPFFVNQTVSILKPSLLLTTLVRLLFLSRQYRTEEMEAGE